MITIVLLLVIFILLAIVVRLARTAAQRLATIRRHESTILAYESTLADYDSAIREWIDYAANLKDRLHGIDAFPLPAIESKELPLFVFGDGSATVKDIATHNLGGYALPANETSPAKSNGNGHKDGKNKDSKTAESKLASPADISKYADILGKLGKLDSDQNNRAIELLSKWYGKDGKSAESKSEEYLKRLRNALKL